MALAGTVGHAAAGWALLESDVREDTFGQQQRDAVGVFCRPQPPLTAGPEAAKAGATAMLDISDGLLRDATRLAKASAVVVDLDPVALKNLAEPLQETAALLGTDPLDWVLGGGEDHGLLSTFPADVPLPRGFTAIGSVLPGHGLAPVTIAGNAAKTAESNTAGWDHFAL